jgi:hypothetical protein
VILDSAAYAANLIATEGYIGLSTTTEFGLIGLDEAYPLNGKYVLENDLDFTGYDWSVAKENFVGTFDGADFAIFNITQKSVDLVNQFGLFASVGDSSSYLSATFKNLTIADLTAVSDSRVGAIAQTANFEVTVENVTIDNAFIRSEFDPAGGLFGYSDAAITFRHVTLTDSIVTGATNTGGLVGRNLYALVENTHTFESYIYGRGSSVGGFFGSSRGEAIYQSSNQSFVIGELDSVGGIIGKQNITKGSIFERVLNTGTIVSNNGYDVGGLVGDMYDSSYGWANFEAVYNTGDVYGVGRVGGLIGDVDDTPILLNQGFNAGNVFASSDTVGGLFGEFDGDYGARITNAYNKGDVTGIYRVGGLMGYSSGADYGTYRNLYNAGKVTGLNAEIGGLFGYINGGDFSIFSNGFNVGEVVYTDETFTTVGQIVGYFSDDLTFQNTYFYWDGMTDIKFATAIQAGNSNVFYARAILDLDRFTAEDFILANQWDFANVWEFVEGSDYDFPVLQGEITDTTEQLTLEDLDEAFFDRFVIEEPA